MSRQEKASLLDKLYRVLFPRQAKRREREKALIEECAGVKIVRKNSADIGPITFTVLPRFTEEQERRLEWESRVERVLETMSKHKDNVLTPEENEEAFQVYMHRRMRQAHNLPPGPIGEDEFGPKKE